MQLVWILLIAAAITVIEILIYHYRLPRFFLFIFPLINICLEICIVFYILRQQALVTSYYPLWIRIGIYLLPLLLSLFIMTGFLVSLQNLNATRYDKILRIPCIFIDCCIKVLGERTFGGFSVIPEELLTRRRTESNI